MFVTIVRKPSPDVGPPMTSTYQCNTVHLQSATDKESFLLVNMCGGEGASVEIDKATDQLYIMNDEGRTIDSYRWSHLVYEADK